MVVVRPVVALVGREADVVPAVHLAGRLVPGDRRVGVAVGLGAAVVEDAEVHRRDQPVGQPAQFRHGLPDHDQARRVPAIVDVRHEVTIVEHRSRLRRAVDVSGIPDHVAIGRVVPLVQEPVVPLQLLDLGQRGPDQGVGPRPADQAEVTGRHHGPQVDADVGRRGVAAVGGRRGRAAREREVVHRQVRRRVHVHLVELPGVPRDAQQVGPLGAGQAAGAGHWLARPPLRPTPRPGTTAPGAPPPRHGREPAQNPGPS